MLYDDDDDDDDGCRLFLRCLFGKIHVQHVHRQSKRRSYVMKANIE